MKHYQELEEPKVLAAEHTAAYSTLEPSTTIKSLWHHIKSLALSDFDCDWLTKQIQEQKQAKHQRRALRYPKIDCNVPISDSVLAMTCSDVSEDFNFEAERDNMYHEWAR